MKKYLLISEKPSLMRLVQAAYNKSNVKNKIDVDFVALHGHCCTLCSPEDYREDWKAWKMNALPMIPDVFKHKPIEKDLVQSIKSQLKSNHYDGLINCTDAEREGQNIFYSLYDFLGCKLPVKRFWVSDLTDEKLIDAWENLKDDQKDPFLVNLTNASLLRANIDWLIGMNFTRVISLANNKVIPVGRVMSVVLSILAKRELEIRNFKPSVSYDVIANYKNSLIGKYIPEELPEGINTAFKTKEEAEAFIDKLVNKAKIKNLSVKERKESAPLLYSLGDLQNDANKEYGYTLAQSLEIIQELYEKKILSYPRTDSNYLTTGEANRMNVIIDACKLIPELANIKIDNSRIKKYASTKYVNDSKVQAHYAIILTGSKFDFSSLNNAQQNIVTLVAKRIVATLLDSATYQELLMETSIEKGDNSFITKESYLMIPGFKALYGYKPDEELNTINNIKLKVNDIIDVSNFNIKEVTTSCPPRYNDATINRAMINVGSTLDDEELKKVLRGTGSKDQGGIGTPATRSQIIEKLLTPKKAGKSTEIWVERKGKSFIVTDAGLAIADAIKDFPISSAILTAQWEQKLKTVEEGDLSSNDFTKEMNQFITDECEKLKSAHVAMSRTNSSVEIIEDVTCPFCGGHIKVSNNYYYCEKYKTEEDCKFIISKQLAGANISLSDFKDLCNKGETKGMNFVKKDGTKFKAKLKIDLDEKQIKFASDNKEFCKCSCGGHVFARKGIYGTFYQCSECGIIVNQDCFGHKLSTKEVKTLYSNKTIDLYGLASQKGKKFNAEIGIKDKKVSVINWIN